MSVTHPTAVRNGLANYVVDLIDAGTDQTNGILTIKQTTPAVLDLVSINFANRAGAGGPGAFGDAVNGVAGANSLPIEGQVSNTGTAQNFTIYDCNNPRTEVCSGSISDTGGAGDIKLSSVNLTSGDYVRLTALTYEAPN